MTTTQTQVRSTEEVLTLALEALENTYALRDDVIEAITAIKEALSSPNGEAQPEQEPVEDLQAKLKWATEQLEANINWEFVAAAKEEMLKAAWAEIKELREQIKEPEQEPVAWGMEGKDGFIFDVICPAEHEREEGGYTTPLYTTPPQGEARGLSQQQRKPLTDEEIGAILEGVNAYGTRLYTFARAIEAAHGIKENT